MAEIGATLREARMRARIDVSEIEAKTKIRAKYLRALENEEWDLLPGPTFVKSFLRTYADRRSASTARRSSRSTGCSYEHPSEPARADRRQPAAAVRDAPGGSGGRRRPVARLHGRWSAIVGDRDRAADRGLLSGGGGGSTTTEHAHGRDGQARTAARRGTRARARARATGRGPRHGRRRRCRCGPTGTVYVCLIGEDGRKLIAGKTLKPAHGRPRSTAKRFELTLGNNAVTLTIDGTPRAVPRQQPGDRLLDHQGGPPDARARAAAHLHMSATAGSARRPRARAPVERPRRR